MHTGLRGIRQYSFTAGLYSETGTGKMPEMFISYCLGNNSKMLQINLLSFSSSCNFSTIFFLNVLLIFGNIIRHRTTIVY